MSGKLPPGHARRYSSIVDSRGWAYTGSRFVSLLSLEISNVALFESPGVAESWADHLRLIGMASGIKVKLADWKAQTRAKYPPIIGTAPATKCEKGWATRKEKARTHNHPALSLSAQRSTTAAMERKTRY